VIPVCEIAPLHYPFPSEGGFLPPITLGPGLIFPFGVGLDPPFSSQFRRLFDVFWRLLSRAFHFAPCGSYRSVPVFDLLFPQAKTCQSIRSEVLLPFSCGRCPDSGRCPKAFTTSSWTILFQNSVFPFFLRVVPSFYLTVSALDLLFFAPARLGLTLLQ